MKRKINLNHIKENCPYSIADICERFDKHKNTVLAWKKEGLKAIDNKKPYLFHGSELKSFLKQKQEARKSKCQDDELFCTKCQKPQKPFGKLVDIFVIAKNRLNLQGLCEVCNCKMNKGFKRKNLALVKKIFDVGKVHNQHLIECFDNTANCDLN